jgi:hypothetical protein
VFLNKKDLNLLNSDEIVTRLTAVVNDAALLFAHEPDDALVKGLKQMRIELRAEFGGFFQEVPEIHALVEEVLTCVAIQRHDIELGAGLPALAGTLH